ncbi:MAG TPA: N(4)-(beta-N-acetylglucosaminyl)-L-asparaginase [Erysipelotrichaceae bacterium]|jgi:isoaspartyl peptidase/L-asparaginase-like protein (Ntn-hydrolase superfamily)|nr:N(4)-(beta-N-acetylglucosaminyl)-L-asparaginase [Erysipelotrichaceae bacterium]
MGYKLISTWKMSYRKMSEVKEMLKRKYSLQEIIEAVIMAVEDNPDFQSVGYGGLPNSEGIVELDAGYMDGDSLAFGAISGVRNIKNPILVASSLIKGKTNNYLTARGAEKYAKEKGFKSRRMLTEKAREKYQNRVKENSHDTICVIGRDLNGSMAVGVSTSGLFMKHPGRVGDSPIIGSGYYCDSQIGGAAATGIGEDIMRGCLSAAIVNYMRQGLNAQKACQEALFSYLKRVNNEPKAISLIALDKDGNYGACSTLPDFPFVILDENNQARLMVYRGQEKRIIEADENWINSYQGD